ncbi:sigma-54-dependent transcriptional regulator [Desulfoplanes sp.]
MKNIIIADDDKSLCDSICKNIDETKNYNLYISHTKSKTLEILDTYRIDLVILDIFLSDGKSLDIIPIIKKASSKPDVIIITGLGDKDCARTAIRCGAWDYIQKPFSKKDMLLSLKRVFQYRAEKNKVDDAPITDLGGIIGSDILLEQVYDSVSKSAATQSNVLLTGETGTGKELFARAIHKNSRYRDKPFVTVDCTSLPESLTESILFGHKKGAFTGASVDHDGLIAQADGGTLFLDEVSEMPLETQKKFLRVLQNRIFRPVGGNKERRSNFRLISATNKNIPSLVESNTFRSDLFYRLNTIHISLPPLRDMPSIINELVDYYLKKLSVEGEGHMKKCSPEFIETLASYSWPGNVREFVGVIEQCLINSRFEKTLFIKHLPENLRIFKIQNKLENSINKSNEPFFSSLKEFRARAIESAEKEYLNKLLEHYSSDINKASLIAGVGRSRFYELLRKYNLK